MRGQQSLTSARELAALQKMYAEAEERLLMLGLYPQHLGPERLGLGMTTAACSGDGAVNELPDGQCQGSASAVHAGVIGGSSFLLALQPIFAVFRGRASCADPFFAQTRAGGTDIATDHFGFGFCVGRPCCVGCGCGGCRRGCLGCRCRRHGGVGCNLSPGGGWSE